MRNCQGKWAKYPGIGAILALILLVGTAHAAVYVVDTDSDDGGLSACTGSPADCSLRGAIGDANAVSGSSTITFDASFFASAQIIDLGSDLPAVVHTLVINGPGTALLTVDGQNAYRPFYVNTGADLTVQNLSITHGSADNGAGIFNGNGGALTVIDCVIADGTASSSGGGIYTSGTLVVRDSVLSGNAANNNTGGGISVSGGNASALVSDSLLVGNSASFSGGGMYNRRTLQVVNSTLVGNTADRGAALYEDSGQGMTVINSTVVGNSNSSNGGSIDAVVDTITLRNSIVAGSTGGHDCDTYSTGAIDAQNSLMQDGTCGVTGGVNGNLTGDPMLGTLADNGGQTQTVALLSGSPAVDAGDDTICANAPVNAVDQRGVTRPQGAHCDIGAYELVDDIFTDGFEFP